VIILGCNAVVIVIVVVSAFLAASVIWHELAKVRVPVTACTECGGSGSAANTGGFEDEDCPRCHGSGADPEDDEAAEDDDEDDEETPEDPDRIRDWAIADRMEAL
jgi:hypothetical protein